MSGRNWPDFDLDDEHVVLLKYIALAGALAGVMWAIWSWRLYLLAVLAGQATVLGLPPIVFYFFVIAFVAGLGFVPLLAWTIGPSIPGFITEMIAAGLLRMAMLRYQSAVLDQTETDEYRIRAANGDLSPQSYWDRWAGTDFGLTFEATKEAFEPTAPAEHKAMIENIEYVDEAENLPEYDRGALDWYVSEGDADADVLVPIGETLSGLRDVAGPGVVFEAYAEALKEYGGDTAEMSNKMMITGSIIMVSIGLMMGWVVFF